MAKARKRIATRKKASKRRKASTKPARKKTAKRATPKKRRPKTVAKIVPRKILIQGVPAIEDTIIDVIDEPLPGVVRVTEYETIRTTTAKPGASPETEE
jgi:membrane-bound ClpP family serine protease